LGLWRFSRSSSEETVRIFRARLLDRWPPHFSLPDIAMRKGRGGVRTEKGERLFDWITSVLADAKQESVAVSITAVNSDCEVHEDGPFAVSKGANRSNCAVLCHLRFLMPD
jgi:hypothetical protein